MKTIADYQNGNTHVVILEDGTKIRSTPEGHEALPEFPESIDLKITNSCDMECLFCHEQSYPEGKHANLSHPLLDSIPSGVEVAIGGGNPLSHPVLANMMNWLAERGVICNLTVNAYHFIQDHARLEQWFKDGLFHGLGISVPHTVPCEMFDHIQKFPYAVVHTVAGIVDKAILRQLADRNLNLLILGYKYYGRGKNYRNVFLSAVENNIFRLRQILPELQDHFRAVSFDNLALEQLDVQHTLFRDDPEGWNTFFMGDDGKFTMYIDLVKEQFAKSSVSPRRLIQSNDIRDLFMEVRLNA